MKLPSQKKILKEDLKGAPSWVDAIINVVNPFMESVYQALNKNITFSDNIAAQIKEITYTTDATYPLPQKNVQFLHTLKTRPIGLVVVQAFETSSYSASEGPVYAPWTESNGIVSIKTITGLDAGKTYTIRLLLF